MCVHKVLVTLSLYYSRADASFLKTLITNVHLHQREAHKTGGAVFSGKSGHFSG